MQFLKAPIAAIFFWVVGFCNANAAESLVIDWTFAPEGKPLLGVYGASAPISIQNIKNATVVSKEATPPNPFQGIAQAVHFPASDTANVVRIRIRPFQDRIPSKGSFEFHFHIVEGSIGLGVGTNSLPWEPGDPTCYGPGKPLLPFFAFTVGEPVGMKAQNIYSTNAVPVIEAGRNYAFRLEWETTGNELRWQFFLNDEPLLGKNGTPLTQATPLEKVGDESLALIIQSGASDQPNGSFFLGKMEAKRE